MPLQRLEIEDVIALADKLGIHLTATEARIFTGRLQDQIGAMEAFLELRIEERRDEQCRPPPHSLEPQSPRTRG